MAYSPPAPRPLGRPNGPAHLDWPPTVARLTVAPNRHIEVPMGETEIGELQMLVIEWLDDDQPDEMTEEGLLLRLEQTRHADALLEAVAAAKRAVALAAVVELIRRGYTGRQLAMSMGIAVPTFFRKFGSDRSLREMAGLTAVDLSEIMRAAGDDQ